jgi:hypothetical protein
MQTVRPLAVTAGVSDDQSPASSPTTRSTSSSSWQGARHFNACPKVAIAPIQVSYLGYPKHHRLA